MFEDKEILKRKIDTNKIIKKVDKIKWKCLYDACNKNAINSHLLQKRKILKEVSENEHVILFSGRNPFYFREDVKSIIDFKKVGINKAFTFPLFCKHHDNYLFSEIEKKKQIDFFDYKTQLLFSYRALIVELFKKNKVLIADKRLIEYTKKEEIIAPIDQSFIERIKLGKNDLYYYKKEMEKEINTKEVSQNFTFFTYKYKGFPIFLSAVISFSKKHLKNQYLIDILPVLFANIIPYKNISYIILGYHNKYTNGEIKKYVFSWRELDKESFQIKLTNLLLRCETWGLSPSLYRKIAKRKKRFEELKERWIKTSSALNDEIDFNLFLGSLK